MTYHDTWWVPVDPRDVSQERELAVLEHRCPDAAAKAWIRKEHTWYRFHCSFPDGEADYVDWWIEKFYTAIATIVKPQRSDESLDRRRECVREWWRENGREYRHKRASQGRARRPRGARPGANACAD